MKKVAKKPAKKPAKKAAATPHGIAKSYTDAARALGVTPRSIRDWKVAGGEPAGFRPDGTVDLDVLFKWLEGRKAKREGDLSLRDQKTFEEVRKLRLASDVKESLLVSRDWVAARIQAAAGEVANLRVKSEAEDPMRFAAAAGDVAGCREIVRRIWDGVLTQIQGLSVHFEEP